MKNSAESAETFFPPFTAALYFPLSVGVNFLPSTFTDLDWLSVMVILTKHSLPSSLTATTLLSETSSPAFTTIYSGTLIVA